MSESLGRRIARLRGDRGFTQQELADRLGISRVAVSHLETGMSIPGERTVALLAGLFRMEPHELVAGTSYPPAKAERLPVVVARWTEVEHQLDLFERDVRWLEGLPPAEAERTLKEWDRDLADLAAGAHDRSEQDRLRGARRRVSGLLDALRRAP